MLSYREYLKKEREKANSDQQVAKNYFERANIYLDKASSGGDSPSYQWANDNARLYADSINDLDKDTERVSNYIESFKGTEQYEQLSKQFNDYRNALSQTRDYLTGLTGFASQYDNEDEYNKGIFEIQAREKVKGKSYDELMAASRNTDNKYVSNWLKDFANENVSLEEITGKRDKALKRQDEVNAQIKKYMDLERAADLPSDKQRYAALLDPLYAEADELTKELRDNGYDDLIKQKQAEADSKKYAEKYKGLDFNQLLSKISDKNTDGENEWLEKQADSVASSEQLRAKTAELTAEVKHINNELGSGAFEGEEYTEKEKQFKRASNALEKYKDLQIIKQREEKAAEYEKLANSPDFAELSKGEWNHIGANDKMTYMTSEEQGIYNYLRNSGKEDEADEYINLIDRRLNERFTQANKEWAQNYATDHPWLASAMSLGSNLISGAGIVEDIGKRMVGEPIDVNSPMHYGANLTNALRSTVSDKYLGDVGVFGYDTVMSAADSAVNMAVASAIGGAVGAVAGTAGSAAASAIAQKATSTTMSLVMGSQVATNTVIDAKERGLTDDQAVTLGVLYGIAETISEKYSIEKWMKDPVSVGSVLKKSFIAEGTEEVVANWLDRAADCLVSGDKSEINQKYKDYINQGFSDKEALTMTLFGMVGEDTTSFLAGGLSGLAMSGVHMAATGAVSEARYAKSEHKSVNELLKPENKGALNKLIKAGKEFDEDSDNYKLAERIEKASADGEKISAKDVKKLRRAVVQQAYKDTVEDVKKLYSVTEGMNDDQRAVVGYVGDKLRRGQSLTNQENAMIRNDGEILKAVSGYIEKDENDVIDMLDAAKFKDNFKYYSSNGNGLLEVDGNEFRGTVEIKSTNPANGRLTLNLIDDNGNSRTISSDDVDFKNDTEAKLYSIAANFSNPNEANAFVENYEGGDLTDYLTEWNLFSNYGRLGYNRDQIYQRSQLDTDTKVRQAAYYSGMEAFKSFAQVQYLNEQAYEAAAQSFKGYQRGTFVNNVSSERLWEMSRAQRKSIRELKMFTFAGLNVELFESKTDKNGNFIGENGSFDAKTKTLRVDINAGFENNSRAVEEATRAYIRLTAAHELTHAAEQGGGYMKLRAEIVRTLEAAGFDYKKLVDKKFNQLSSQDKYKGIAKDKLYRLADEETIADCCETLLNDSKVFEKLFNADKTLAEKFINAVKRAIEKLRQFFKENPTYARTEYGKALQEAMSKVENRVQELWDEAVAQGIRAENKESGSVSYNERGDINSNDIQILRSIGRKSVFSFTSEDIKKSEKWARKFYKGLGEKSPFFRAWFGDWRNNDNTPVKVVDIEKGSGYSSATISIDDLDGRWSVRTSTLGVRNTKSHAGAAQKSVYGLKNIAELIKNSIYLDCEVHEHHFNNKPNDNIAFDHKFYALGRDNENNIGLYKITIDDIFQSKSQPNDLRFHNLRHIVNIEKVADSINDSSSQNESNEPYTANVDVSTTNYTVSDLYAFVKQYDKEFRPTESSKVVDKDGKPLVVYHQTNADFTVFDTEIKGAGYYDDETPIGIFLKPSDSDIGINGKKQMPLYASIKNPLKVNNRQELVKYYEKNIDGYTDKKNAIKNLESEYHKRFEEEMKRENAEYQKQWEAWRRGDITEEDYRKATDRSGAEKVMEEWERDENALRRELKQIISDYLKKSKYDGVIIEQDSGSFGRSTKTYIAFDNTQVKSATDNIGTYDRNNADINYSDRFDTDYLSAVERGDMKTAQKMVDEAAKAAGYNSPKLYHGTRSFGFTKFDLKKMDDGISIFLTSTEETASTYSGNNGIRRIGKKSEVIDKLNGEELAKMYQETRKNDLGGDYLMRYFSQEEARKMITASGRASTLYTNYINMLPDLSEGAIITYRSEDPNTPIHIVELKDARSYLHYVLDDISGNYALYAKLQNPLVIDAKGALWNNLRWRHQAINKDNTHFIDDGKGFYRLIDNNTGKEIENGIMRSDYWNYLHNDVILSKDRIHKMLVDYAIDYYGIKKNTRAAAKFAKEYGYDGVIFKNIEDNGGQNGSVNAKSDVYVVFNPSKVKSADPVTYDDDGNVIPLSERFNEEKEDIRYSDRYSNDDIRNSVQNHFGHTYSWNETGYITTDGQRIDFSGRHEGAPGGRRSVDHRDIWDGYPEELQDKLDGSEAMYDFISRGNIRIHPEMGGINLAVEPTSEQKRRLRDYISRERGEVTLDITDKNGNTLLSTEYPKGTSSSKIFSDISEFFANGTKPTVSDLGQFRYQDRYNEYDDLFDMGEDLFEDSSKREVLDELIEKYPDDALYIIKHAAEQTVENILTKTKSVKLDDDAYLYVARKFMREYNISRAANPEEDSYLAAKIKNIVARTEVGELSQSEIMNEFINAARDALLLSGTLDDSMKEEREFVLGLIKGKTLLVTDYNESNIRENYGDLTRYRSKLGHGYISLERNANKKIGGTRGVYIDEIISEIKEAYPSLIDEDANEATGFYWLERLLNDKLEPTFKSSVDSTPEIDAVIGGYEIMANLVDKKASQIVNDSKNGQKFAQLGKTAREFAREQRKAVKEAVDKAKEKERQKAKKDIKEAREKAEARYKAKLEKKEQQFKEKLDEQREKTRELRREKNDVIIAEKQKRVNDLRRLRDNRERREVIEKINKTAAKMRQMILRPTDTAYVPDEFKNGFIEVTDGITQALKLSDDTKIGQHLNKLSDLLRKLATDDRTESVFGYEFDENFRKRVEEFAAVINGKKIDKNLTLREANDIHNLLKSVVTIVRNANKLINSQERRSISEAGIQIMLEQENLDSKWLNKQLKTIKKYFMTPLRMSEIINAYNDKAVLTKLVNELNRGVRKKNMFFMVANKMFDDYREKNVKELDHSSKDVREIRWTDNAGNSRVTRMTGMQAMQICMTWNREIADDNLVHISEGGLTIFDPDQLAKGNNKKALEKATKIHGVNNSFITSVASSLTRFEKGYIDIAEQYFNEYSKDAINETSLALKHFKIANSKYYIPIKVDKNSIAKEIEGIKFDSSVENQGMFNSVVPKSRKSIYIQGLDSLINNHIQGVSNYYGLAIPIRNLNKTLNVRNVEYDADGVVVNENTVKDALNKNWGEMAINNYEQMLTDLQNSRASKGELNSKEINKFIRGFRSNFVTSVLNFNPSVTLKQAASYFTAGAYIDGSILGKGFAHFWAKYGRRGRYKALLDEIDSHTAQHYIRRQGLSSNEIADINDNWLSKAAQNTKIGRKITTSKIAQGIPSGFNPNKWIQNMDCLTTAMLWVATKDQVNRDFNKAKKEIGTDEYWQAVTDLYDKVIEDTQPMYDPLHRPEVLKSSNELVKSIFMFKTQPLQNAGIIYDALGRAVQGNKGAIRKLGKAVASQTASLVTFALMTFVVSLARHNPRRYRDENDELTVESIFDQVKEDIFTNGMGILFPFGGTEIMTMFTQDGDAVQDNVAVQLNEFIGACRDLYDTIDKHNEAMSMGLETDPQNILSALKDFAVVVSQDITGLPVNNAIKNIEGVTGWINDVFFDKDNQLLAPTSEPKNKQVAGRFARQIESGNTAEAEKILNEFYQKELEKAKADKDIKNPENKAAQKTRDMLVSAYKTEYQKAFLRQDSKQMERIARILIAGKKYMIWDNGKTSLSKKLDDWRKSAKDDLQKK